MYVSQQGHKIKNDSNRYNHLVLLCENQEGYRNLIKLVSTGFLEGFYYKPRIDKDLLAQHSKGLIALSACLRGDINETLLADRYDEAQRHGATSTPTCSAKNNFFLEMQDHGLDQDKIVMPAGEPALARDRHSAGGDQRLALPAQERRPRARDPALHPDRQDHDATRTGCASSTPEFYLKTRERNDGAVRRIRRRARSHRGTSRSAATSSWRR